MRNTSKTPPASPPRERDPKFARDLTRAEFGRFYWDDQRAQEVRRACVKPKERPPRK